MKKDIQFPLVEGVKIAIARKINAINQPEWQVFLINRNRQTLTNVFVTSKGYGVKDEIQKDEVHQKTSTLRHFFAEVPSGSHHLIEPIDPHLFHLTNEFWVSYYIGSQLYDKKFIFVPDSITEANLIPIQALGLEGVLHE
ncbi:MAG: hypothetical protein LH606_10780 [Cytophagaceae bacterium]|nr:hypothetical protein [Cytophagaceae bacterium]